MEEDINHSQREQDLISRHLKEQRDLQAQSTQRKKNASKKTRKAVNDECETLAQAMQLRHAHELLTLNGRSGSGDPQPEIPEEDDILASIADIKLSTEQRRISETAESEPAQRKPNRQKARLARRAAEQAASAAQAAVEADDMPDLKKQERDSMIGEFTKRGLQEKEVAANGHCLYLAMADQLNEMTQGVRSPETSTEESASHEKHTLDFKQVRKAAADYMQSNPADFEPFLEEPFNSYLHKIRDTAEWGGQLELMALAKTYEITINVIQADGRVETIEGATSKNLKDAWLAYYRHGFGLGEHYNSLRLLSEKSPAQAHEL